MTALVSKRAREIFERRQLRVAQMVGDPWVPFDRLPIARRAIQYATAMARREGLIPDDASGYFARFDPARRAVFLSPDAPDGVIDFRSTEHIRPSGGVVEFVFPTWLLPEEQLLLDTPIVEDA
jgi:hypothetical protein